MKRRETWRGKFHFLQKLACALALGATCSCSSRVQTPRSLEELYELQVEMLVDPAVPESDRDSVWAALCKSNDRILWKVLINHWDDMRVVDPEYTGDHNLAPEYSYVLTLGGFCREIFPELTGLPGYGSKEEMLTWWERVKDLYEDEIHRLWRLDTLQERWRDRWFLMSVEDRRVGWRHQTASRWQESGQSGWTITEECENEIGEGAHTRYLCTVRCLDDDNLTPLRMEWSLVDRSPLGLQEYAQEIVFAADTATLKVTSGFNAALNLAAGQTYTASLGAEGATPFSLWILAPFLAEIQEETYAASVTRRYVSQDDLEVMDEKTLIRECVREDAKRERRIVRDSTGYFVEGYTFGWRGLESQSIVSLTLTLSDAQEAAKFEWKCKPGSTLREGK